MRASPCRSRWSPMEGVVQGRNLQDPLFLVATVAGLHRLRRTRHHNLRQVATSDSPFFSACFLRWCFLFVYDDAGAQFAWRSTRRRSFFGNYLTAATFSTCDAWTHGWRIKPVALSAAPFWSAIKHRINLCIAPIVEAHPTPVLWPWNWLRRSLHGFLWTDLIPSQLPIRAAAPGHLRPAEWTVLSLWITTVWAWWQASRRCWWILNPTAVVMTGAPCTRIMVITATMARVSKQEEEDMWKLLWKPMAVSLRILRGIDGQKSRFHSPPRPPRISIPRKQESDLLLEPIEVAQPPWIPRPRILLLPANRQIRLLTGTWWTLSTHPRRHFRSNPPMAKTSPWPSPLRIAPSSSCLSSRAPVEITASDHRNWWMMLQPAKLIITLTSKPQTLQIYLQCRNAKSGHRNRLRRSKRFKEVYPEFGDISIFCVHCDTVHRFDPIRGHSKSGLPLFSCRMSIIPKVDSWIPSMDCTERVLHNLGTVTLLRNLAATVVMMQP